MSYWILPQILTNELRDAALSGNELALPAEGLAALDRAQGTDQIAEWLRQLQPEATPERITALSEHYWYLGHHLLPEDIIVVRVREGSAYLIGEIAGVYRRVERPFGMAHVWPAKWLAVNIGTETAPALAQYAGYESLTEIHDEHALICLKPYVPALRKGNTAFFKWLAIIILIFELIYFWPKE